MKKYVLPYGQGSKEIELDETLVLKEVRTKEFEPLKNIPYEVLEAIYHPIGCPPINEIIKPGQKVAFICNDPTRVANSFDFMPVLVNEMNKLGRQRRRYAHCLRARHAPPDDRRRNGRSCGQGCCFSSEDVQQPLQ